MRFEGQETYWKTCLWRSKERPMDQAGKALQPQYRSGVCEGTQRRKENWVGHTSDHYTVVRMSQQAHGSSPSQGFPLKTKNVPNLVTPSCWEQPRGSTISRWTLCCTWRYNCLTILSTEAPLAERWRSKSPWLPRLSLLCTDPCLKTFSMVPLTSLL